ncbi:hypothetical protein T06_9982 [Trichinella sp. T6]|nr:hypothetical protein T06_9982 [Trichinella sp. T6]
MGESSRRYSQIVVSQHTQTESMYCKMGGSGSMKRFIIKKFHKIDFPVSLDDWTMHPVVC